MKINWHWSNKEDQWQKGVPESVGNTNCSVSINGNRFQKMLGFGACLNELGYTSLHDLRETDRKNLLEELFSESKDDGCNFQICRFPVGANDYSFNWYSLDDHYNDWDLKCFSIERDQEALIPYIREVLNVKNDIVLMVSPWSPPIWMKEPSRYNGGHLKKDPEVQNTYAKYLTRFIEAYKYEGIHISQLHVQNEPVANQIFPSCLWTGKDLKIFIRDYLGPYFVKTGVNQETELWLGTINAPGCDFNKMIFDKWPYEDYDYFANEVLSDEKAASYISGVSYQWGGKIAIQRTFESWWPKFRLMQSENESGFGDNTWDTTLYNWTMLKHYISNGAESYLYWNLILPPKGISTWGDPQNSMVTVDNHCAVMNPDFYLMKHFSSIVKKGAVRLGLIGNYSGDTLIFENPDGSYAVEMMNPFKESHPVQLEICGNDIFLNLPARSLNSIRIEP